MSNPKSDDLSNWGRWGADDQRGALNLITPEIIKQAAGLVKTGRTYSLSVPLETQGPQWPLRQKIWRVMEHKSFKPTGPGGSGDALMMHSHSGTHIDALCHYWYDNQLYNGYDPLFTFYSWRHRHHGRDWDRECHDRYDFFAKHGFKITYMPFIARASIAALREFPQVNASIEGDEIAASPGLDEDGLSPIITTGWVFDTFTHDLDPTIRMHAEVFLPDPDGALSPDGVGARFGMSWGF